MQVSPVGFLICVVIFFVAYRSGAPLMVGLLASAAFGSTALVTLTSLGGSSPLIYTFFSVLLVIAVTLRKHIWQDLGSVFGKIRPVWLLLSLMAYAIVGCWLFPRLFAGQTSAFVQSATRTGVVETSLGPTTGNITQTGYFILGGLTALAICVQQVHKNRIAQIHLGFMAWCTLHTGMGVLYLLGKMAGGIDVLEVTRTANYAILTDHIEAGFMRIAGSYSEASAFAAASLACLSYTYVTWRKTKSRYALALTLVLLFLLALSTSTTAYLGLIIISLPVAWAAARPLARGLISRHDLLILSVLVIGIALVFGLSLYDQRILDPIVQLVDTAVINKGNSSSGLERGYWNVRSMQSFIDTNGFGLGFGSSRASSWLIAVISQLGIVGSLMMAALVAVVARGLGGLERYSDAETVATVAAVRAAGLSTIVAGSLVSGTADPGLIFFVAFAVVTSSRALARNNRYWLTERSQPASNFGLAGNPA